MQDPARQLGQDAREGLAAAAGYMDRCAAAAGHLVIFDRSAKPRDEKVFRRTEEFDGKRIEVWGM